MKQQQQHTIGSPSSSLDEYFASLAMETRRRQTSDQQQHLHQNVHQNVHDAHASSSSRSKGETQAQTPLPPPPPPLPPSLVLISDPAGSPAAARFQNHRSLTATTMKRKSIHHVDTRQQHRDRWSAIGTRNDNTNRRGSLDSASSFCRWRTDQPSMQQQQQCSQQYSETQFGGSNSKSKSSNKRNRNGSSDMIIPPSKSVSPMPPAKQSVTETKTKTTSSALPESLRRLPYT
eukprot:CAMPEP_0119571070 /NCGR_PEP_ID=MMETSP1352-20130426/43935_1 /TAXON_ID=265584 /ORGANISM="Stauroneis constricta, Strain CCMP1120" /LENGTH=231 /DNA_ID=CAMNT_0007620749 /DNA_START=771 /DNA_END=1466 /DNA_ORIENTATION=+